MASLLQRRVALDGQNQFGDTPLIGAARGGHAAVCDLLLRAGADRKLRNGDRMSAEEAAELRGFTTLAQRVANAR